MCAALETRATTEAGLPAVASVAFAAISGSDGRSVATREQKSCCSTTSVHARRADLYENNGCRRAAP